MKPAKPRSHQPFLSLRGAAFRLGERLVFENTSWRFQRHEHWAIVGANGAGKSLLADAVRGHLPLVQGELEYHFQPAQGLAAEECIGHVSFEERKAQVHDTVVQSRWNTLEEASGSTVKEFLSYERVMDINPYEISRRHEQGKTQFARRLRRAIGLLEIAPFLDRRLLSLSNGEMQRIHLARALVPPLRLLILDEPFTGLDVAARGHFRRVLEGLMRTSLRVLLITARAEELTAQVSHLLWVDACRVVASGPRGAVLAAGQAGRSGMLRRKPSPTGASRPDHKLCEDRVGKHAGAVKASPRELVRMRRVTVRYGTTDILHEVDWTIRSGKSWALLGPNGSGKTTLLSLILGDHPQVYQNDLRVFGRQRGGGESIWDIKRRIGWVSPEFHLHFDNSVSCLDVVVSGWHDTVGLFQRPTPRQRAAARRRLAHVGLLELSREPLSSLSAGQQRLVFLARALVKSPRLLILDEACQGLDAEHRHAFVQTVERLLVDGRMTAVYVTHQEAEIPKAIRRILRLAGGRGVEGRRK